MIGNANTENYGFHFSLPWTNANICKMLTMLTQKNLDSA
jgi:hypothetical protein